MSVLPKDVFAPQRGRRNAERRTNSSCRASMREAQPRPDKQDRSPFGAPPRSCAGVPDSAWAALPGIAGCKREDPLRRQCSEHLAVRHAPDGLIPKPPEGYRLLGGAFKRGLGLREIKSS